MTYRFTKGGPTDTQNKLGDWHDHVQRAVVQSGTAGGGVAHLSDAYQVRYLSTEDIAAGELLDAEQTRRWRHLVLSGQDAHGEVELDDAHDVMALHEGPMKDGLLAALARAEQLTDDYEASVLVAAPLRFIALLLENDDETLVMPFPPNMTPLATYRTVTIAETMRVPQPLAADLLQASAGNDPLAG